LGFIKSRRSHLVCDLAHGWNVEALLQLCLGPNHLLHTVITACSVVFPLLAPKL